MVKVGGSLFKSTIFAMKLLSTALERNEARIPCKTRCAFFSVK